MTMRCNLDAKGRAVRLVAGVLMVLIAALLGVLIVVGSLAGSWWWVASFLGGVGSFVVFEARSGWCVVRAIGFRTWI
jgi:hypothetical protein